MQPEGSTRLPRRWRFVIGSEPKTGRLAFSSLFFLEAGGHYRNLQGSSGGREQELQPEQPQSICYPRVRPVYLVDGDVFLGSEPKTGRFSYLGQPAKPQPQRNTMEKRKK